VTLLVLAEVARGEGNGFPAGAHPHGWEKRCFLLHSRIPPSEEDAMKERERGVYLDGQSLPLGGGAEARPGRCALQDLDSAVGGDDYHLCLLLPSEWCVK
jgi:hypothetical protein